MLATRLKATLLSEGAALVGFADVRPLPAPLRDGLPAAVSVAVALPPLTVASLRRGPTPRYHVEWARANDGLDALTARAAEMLRRHGHEAVLLPPSPTDVDTFTPTRPLAHKSIAALAGLGWIGKCDLLVTRSFGTAVRVRTVLTDAPLPAAEPNLLSSCGDCRACIEACPGRAPRGTNWRFLIPRAEVLDADACRSTSRRVADRAGMPDLVCGLCIPVCPWTLAYLARACA